MIKQNRQNKTFQNDGKNSTSKLVENALRHANNWIQRKQNNFEAKYEDKEII